MTQRTGSHGDETLWRRWNRNAEQAPDREAIIHWCASAEPWRWTWEALMTAANDYAFLLHGAGLRAGEVCAVIARHNRSFYPLYMAIEALGAIPSVLAYPNPRTHPDKFRQGLQGMAIQSGLDWVLTDDDLKPIVEPLLQATRGAPRGILCAFDMPPNRRDSATRCVHEIVGHDDACIQQHSSGTTGLQKAVVLSHRAVLRHLGNYARAIDLRTDDRIVSWLPLYHDMGLIAAFHLPLAFGIPTVQIDPFEWIASPAILMEAIARERGTLSWLPNFAFNLLTDRVHDEEIVDVCLDSVRMLINCSEPIRAESHRRFLSRYEPRGLKRTAIAACYAMAETTFAVCQSVPGSSLRVVEVSREYLARGVVEPADRTDDVRECVSSGAPIPECNVRIVDAAGNGVGDDVVGEIVVQSVSLFDGYRNKPDETAAVLSAGSYRTGDYGFLRDGECYVIGRKKDVIIVAGKNIYPEDVEDALSQVAGVIPGRVVACGLDDPLLGTEQLWVVAETELPSSAHPGLKVDILRATMAIDVSVSKVVLVPPRWLIKSTAGKLSRRANAERAAEFSLSPMSHR